MKALKKEYVSYFAAIIAAIQGCYGSTGEPSGSALMELYWEIGRNICLQGEKAFVAYLVYALGERYPQIKGVSARNLRRMRELYRSYEQTPELKELAMTVGWTQNVLILEGCETENERGYYLKQASSLHLSKLALLRLMENGEDTIALCEASESVNGAVSERGHAKQDKTSCMRFTAILAAFLWVCFSMERSVKTPHRVALWPLIDSG